MTDPARLRVGWRAVLADTACAVLAMVLAYLLRFGVGEAAATSPTAGRLMLMLVVAVQIGVAAVAGLYRLRGQVMWPVRLAAGALAGLVAGLLLATWAEAGEGVSRQALAGQAALFALRRRHLALCRRAEGAAAAAPGDPAAVRRPTSWSCRARISRRWPAA